MKLPLVTFEQFGSSISTVLLLLCESNSGHKHLLIKTVDIKILDAKTLDTIAVLLFAGCFSGHQNFGHQNWFAVTLQFRVIPVCVLGSHHSPFKAGWTLNALGR